MNSFMGESFGWIGVALGLFVAPPQLIKIIKTGKVADISKLTYFALVFALLFYLLHAIYIQSLVFAVAQSINLVTNGAILVCIIRAKKSKG